MKNRLFAFLILFVCFKVTAQTLDPTFGPNGGIVTDNFSFSPSDDLPTGGVLQSDGKVIVIGRTNCPGASYDASWGFVSRLLPTGVLDLSFNNRGFRLFSSQLDAVVLQADGKIIVGSYNMVCRLNADGSLDTTFNNSGYYYFSSNVLIKSLALQFGGKIVVGCNVREATGWNLALGCLNSNGTADMSFDADGLLQVAENISGTSSNSLVIQPFDGKIIIASRISSSATNTDFLLARVNSFGTIDTSYGTNGMVTIDQGSTDAAPSIDIQANGKLILAGYSSNGGSAYITIRKINTDGTLDTFLVTTGWGSYSANAFNKPIVKCFTGGYIVGNQDKLCRFYDNNPTAFQQSYIGLFGLSSLLLKPDQSIIVGGYTGDFTANQNTISLLNFDSLLVNSNNIQLNLATAFDRLIDVVELSNGKTIALVGSKTSGYSYNALLVRRNVNGNVDTLFGTDGTGVADTGLLYPYRMVKQTDGKVLISSIEGYIKRYTADGVLDTSFANVGTLDFSAATNPVVSFVDNLYTTSDGKIYVVFDYWLNDKLNVGLYRLNNDGSIDTAFGVDGIASVRFDYFSSDEYEWPNSIFIDATNKITVGCSMNYNGTWIAGLARFNSDGTPETSFGTNGHLTYPDQTGTYYFPYSITGTINNKLIVNGRLDNNQLISRLNADGTMDNTFGTTGTVTVPESNGCMAIQPDGKILYSFGDSIKRLNSDGTTDTSFGNSGILNTQIYSLYNHSIYKLLLTQSNKLLEAGYTYNGSKYIGTLIRYTDLNLGTLEFSTENNFLVYPNPVVDKTQFQYTLKENTQVSIQLFTIEGQLVKNIINSKNQPAGVYKQTVEMDNLTVGNYLLVFSSPEGTQTIKIIKTINK